jgi:hypothetical protein
VNTPQPANCFYECLQRVRISLHDCFASFDRLAAEDQSTVVNSVPLEVLHEANSKLLERFSRTDLRAQIGSLPKPAARVCGIGQRGSVLVEMAAAVIILSMLILGGLDLNLAAQSKGNLAYVCRETAQCVHDDPSGYCGQNPQGFAQSLADGIGLHAPVTVTAASCGANCSTVTATMQTQPIGPFFPQLHFSVQATAQ